MATAINISLKSVTEIGFGLKSQTTKTFKFEWDFINRWNDEDFWDDTDIWIG